MCATVLPVLFIALMLEGRELTQVAVWAARRQVRELRRLRARVEQAVAEADRAGHHQTVIAVSPIGYGWLALPAVACILLFGLGEVSAVLALDARHASWFEHACVLAALVGLPSGLVLVTSVSLVRSSYTDLRQQAATPTPDDPPSS